MLHPPAPRERLDCATYAAAASQPGVLYTFAVDSVGYAYLGGTRWSTTTDPYPGCASLTKLNQTGTIAVWSLCLPLPNINAIAVDQQGHVYVAGSTQSAPVSTTVLKLSPNAQQAIYSTSISTR